MSSNHIPTNMQFFYRIIMTLISENNKPRVTLNNASDY